jgi:hypothetical protein
MGLFGNRGTVVPNGYDMTLPDNTLYGSKVINGQNVPVLTRRQYYPSQAAAPYWYGNGSKPATLAGFAPQMARGSSSGFVNSSTAIGGGPSMDDGASAWDVRMSPTGWAVAFLIVGFIGLRHIHWRAE